MLNKALQIENSRFSKKMEKLASYLFDNLGNWKITILALIGFILIQIFLASYIIPQIETRQPSAVENGLLVMMDFQPLASSQKEYSIINLYKRGILGYVYLLYAFDFLIPLSLAIFFASLIGIGVKHMNGFPRKIILVAFTPLVFDYLENINALFLISQNPTHLYPELSLIEGIITAIKLTASFLLILGTALLFLYILFKKIGHKI